MRSTCWGIAAVACLVGCNNPGPPGAMTAATAGASAISTADTSATPSPTVDNDPTPSAGGIAPMSATSGTGVPSAGTAGQAAGQGGSVAATSGRGGSGGSGAPGSDAPSKAMRPCLTKPSQVVFIGDSYINYDAAHTLLSTLIEERAVKDGALKSGDKYRNYAVPGTALAADSLLGSIPPQWDEAVAEDPDIKFVIMDGGGNDVLIDHMECLADGSDKDPGCQAVVADTLRIGTELINKIKSAGVSDGIYFFYPHVPVGGNDINDYSLGMLKSQAASLATPTFHTYVLDLIPVFDGHDDWFSEDGIHANDTGENKIADEIWKLMKENCIAQPASSGCCAP